MRDNIWSCFPFSKSKKKRHHETCNALGTKQARMFTKEQLVCKLREYLGDNCLLMSTMGRKKKQCFSLQCCQQNSKVCVGWEHGSVSLSLWLSDIERERGEGERRAAGVCLMMNSHLRAPPIHKHLTKRKIPWSQMKMKRRLVVVVFSSVGPLERTSTRLPHCHSPAAHLLPNSVPFPCKNTILSSPNCLQLGCPCPSSS